VKESVCELRNVGAINRYQTRASAAAWWGVMGCDSIHRGAAGRSCRVRVPARIAGSFGRLEKQRPKFSVAQALVDLEHREVDCKHQAYSQCLGG